MSARDGIFGDDPPTPGPRASGPGQLFGRLRVMTVADLQLLPERDYILEGLIAPGEMSLWVGPPKCGKSFLAMHLGYAIAQGRRVFRRDVRQCPVLYVAAEGEGGIAKRVRALAKRYGIAPQFYTIAQAVDVLGFGGGEPDTRDIVYACQRLGIGLVILDTLSRVTPGADENAAEDMTRFIATVADIREQTGAHVATVHHGTKASEGRTPRGHSSLTGAVDLMMEVMKGENGDRAATVAFAKDDAEGDALPFRLEVVEVGQRDNGKPVTTLELHEPDGPKPVPPRKNIIPHGVNQRTALRVLQEETAAHGELLPDELQIPGKVHGIRVGVWRHAFKNAYPDSNPNSVGKAFVRATQELANMHLIGLKNDWAWDAQKPEN